MGLLDLSSCDWTCGSNRKRAAIQLCSAAAVMTDITETFQEKPSSPGGEKRQEIRKNLGKPGKTGQIRHQSEA